MAFERQPEGDPTTRAPSDFNEHDVKGFVGRAKYPLTRSGLVDYARESYVPDEFISRLERIPEKEYRDWNDVYREL